MEKGKQDASPNNGYASFFAGAFFPRVVRDFALGAVLEAVFLAGVRRALLGVFFTHSRKNTESAGSVREMLWSHPCMGTSWVLIAVPLVTPPPPNSLASELNTSAQVPR